MRTVAIFILTLCLLPAAGFAQLKEDVNPNMAQALVKPGGPQNILSLIGLDPSRFSMSHSYSFTVGTGGGESYGLGLYLNTMRYQLSDPISMYLQLGVAHQPFGDRLTNSSRSEAFVSGVGMEYKPSDNFKVQLQFSRRPSNYYSPYSYPYRNQRPIDSMLDGGSDDED